VLRARLVLRCARLVALPDLQLLHVGLYKHQVPLLALALDQQLK
jgi:hypothetical protein